MPAGYMNVSDCAVTSQSLDLARLGVTAKESKPLCHPVLMLTYETILLWSLVSYLCRTAGPGKNTGVCRRERNKDDRSRSIVIIVNVISV